MLDTFSGIGGFSLAAEWTGAIDTIGFVEIDPWCRRVLAKHWPGIPQHGDIRTLTAEQVRGWLAAHADREGESVVAGNGGAGRGDLGTRTVAHTPRRGLRRGETSGQGGLTAQRGEGEPRLDIVTGGFPCQPFSAAGRRQGAGDDRYLWPELSRLVAILRPRWCLFENVPGIINLAGGLEQVHADLEAENYQVGSVVIPAAAVGAPHRRDRVWIIANSPNAQRPRLQGHGGEHGLRESRVQVKTLGNRDGSGHSINGHETLSGVGFAADGISRWLDERLAGGPLDAFGPGWEDGVPRVTQHELDRVHKLKALGNAIVPQVAYVLLSIMLEADDACAILA